MKKVEYWECNNIELLQNAKIAISELLKKLKQLFPRSTGSQWNIPKIHEQLHIAYNIHLWGSHRNVHTGPQEHNHIENTKKLCNRTQKRKAVFDSQLANLLVDGYIINHTQNMMCHQNVNQSKISSSIESSSILQSTHMASKFMCFMKADNNNVTVESKWTSGIQKGDVVEKV